MRQILSGFLATAMIVSVASAVSFAATAPSFVFTPVKLDIDPVVTAGGTVNGFDSSKNKLDVKAKVNSIHFVLNKTGASDPVGEFDIPVDSKEFSAQVTMKINSSPDTHAVSNSGAVTVISKADMKKLLLNKSFSSVQIDGKIYNGKIVASGTDDLKVEFSGAAVDYDSVAWSLDITETYSTAGLDMRSAGGTTPLDVVSITETYTGNSGVHAGTVQTGNGQEVSDVEKTGDFFKSRDITDVIWCYGDGAPVPMTEKGVGTDKDLNEDGGVQSGKTLYFMIRDDVVETFKDDTFWKIKVTKGDNAKLIKNVTDTTKIFSGNLVDANTGTPIDGINFKQRHRYIKVEMNEIYTDDEYKCTLDLRLSPTAKAERKYADEGVDGSEIKIKDFYFWVKNIVKQADNDWKVGIGGLMLNPLQNDWNEVTYFDEDGDLAFMKFFADSDVSKFYAKLSTKWEHADYASYFNDQDAYIFDFVGSPKISATSRCDLQIYNPFVNDDGDETIDPSTAVIYQVIDGDLFDVTDNFTYEEGENGDMAFVTRTRFLGTYIICEKAVEEAAGNADVDELVPEAPVDEAPTDAAPGDQSGKAPANTGRFA